MNIISISSEIDVLKAEIFKERHDNRIIETIITEKPILSLYLKFEHNLCLFEVAEINNILEKWEQEYEIETCSTIYNRNTIKIEIDKIY